MRRIAQILYAWLAIYTQTEKRVLSGLILGVVSVVSLERQKLFYCGNHETLKLIMSPKRVYYH